MKNVVEQRKFTKASVNDDIGAELIKIGLEKLIAYLHRMIVRIWGKELLPEEWK